MRLKKHNSIELWPACYPSEAHCDLAVDGVCDCRYHVVDIIDYSIYSFADLKEAMAKFNELAGLPGSSLTLSDFVKK